MTVLSQPTIQPALAHPITIRLSVCATARLQTYAMTNNLTISDIVRRLIKTGWAVHMEGADIDMPLGAGIKLAEGLPGANGAADMPAEQEAQ